MTLALPLGSNNAVSAPPQVGWGVKALRWVGDPIRDTLLAIYDLLVTRQLRQFYFGGYTFRWGLGGWGNQSPAEICFQMTGVEARFWSDSPESIARCALEMERHFRCWDTTAMSFIYFTVMSFAVVKLLCICTSRGPHSADCDACRYQTVISQDELKRMLESNAMRRNES
jgi:hypothetical protein